MKKMQTFTDNLCLKDLTSKELSGRRTTKLDVIFRRFPTGTDPGLSPEERVL